MDPTVITLIVVTSFIIMLLSGMPVFGALGLASVIGIVGDVVLEGEEALYRDRGAEAEMDGSGPAPQPADDA